MRISRPCPRPTQCVCGSGVGNLHFKKSPQVIIYTLKFGNNTKVIL